jgi:outer membrane protein assembly factor BamB
MRYIVATTLMFFSLGSFSVAIADEIDPSFSQQLSGSAHWSAPAVVELDGNPFNGEEIVSATQRGAVAVHNTAGGLLWESYVPGAPCGESAYVQSSPAVADLDGNGLKEVVIGLGPVGKTRCSGGVAAFNGQTGGLLWFFDLTKQSPQENFHSVIATPSIADADGDGKMEIAFGGLDRNIYVLSYNGTKVFKYQAADTVFSSPQFANVDFDPTLELIASSDISANKFLKTEDGGLLYAFKIGSLGPRVKCRSLPSKAERRACRKGRRLSRSSGRKTDYHFLEESAFIWKRALDQVIQSAPVVADVISASPGQEVVVGSGCFFPQGTGVRRGQWIKVMSSVNGTVLATLPLTSCIASSPTVADLNGDGLREILITSSGHSDRGGNGTSYLSAWTPETNSFLWQKQPRVAGDGDSLLGDHARQAVVADFDGNGSVEVVLAFGGGVQIYKGGSGEALLCEERPCAGRSILNANGLYGVPAIGDTNGDSLPDLVVTRNAVRVWENMALLGLSSGAGPFEPFTVPWAMWRQNPNRSPDVR